MSVFVVDTNVVSYIFARKHPLSYQYSQLLIGNQLIISFMTLAELWLWPLANNWGVSRRQELDRHLSLYTVKFPDDGLCSLWAEVMNESVRKGCPISSNDAWIAATALDIGAPLVTENVKHFRHIGRLALRTRF